MTIFQNHFSFNFLPISGHIVEAVVRVFVEGGGKGGEDMKEVTLDHGAEEEEVEVDLGVGVEGVLGEALQDQNQEVDPGANRKIDVIHEVKVAPNLKSQRL